MRKKKLPAWNKGICHLSDDAKKRIGIAMKKRIAEKGHPRGMLGKHHSRQTIERLKLCRPTEEQRKKMAHHMEKHPMWSGDRKSVICPICNKVFLIPPNHRQTFCSNKCRCISRRTPLSRCLLCNKELGGRKRKFCNKCKGIYYSGERCGAWKGGLTTLNKIIRSTPKYIRWRTACFVRDNYACVICEKKGFKLNVDHYPIPMYKIIRENNLKTLQDAYMCSILWDINNGRTLCYECHKNTDTWAGRGIKR